MVNENYFKSSTLFMLASVYTLSTQIQHTFFLLKTIMYKTMAQK